MSGYTGRLSVRGALSAVAVVACLLIGAAVGNAQERQLPGEPLDPSDPLYGLTPLILPDTPEVPPLVGADGLREDLDCYSLGTAGTNPSFSNILLLIGNRIDVNEDRALRRIRPVLRVDTPAGATVKLGFAVYEKEALGDPTWTRIWYAERTVLMTNQAAQYESPDIGITLLSSGKQYLVAVAWETPAVRFWRITQGVGAVDYGAGFVYGSEVKDISSLPPAETLNYVNSQNRFAMDVCFTPLPGACCLGAVCDDQFLTTPDACAGFGGVFSAPGLSCAEITCPLPTGACCDFDGQGGCFITSQPFCAWNNGTYGGGGTTCDICDPPGACCLYGGDCVDFLTQSECDALDSTGWTVDATCANVECPVQGACCPAAGTGCQEWSPNLCTQLGGAYTNDGVHCAEGPCETAIGACCDYFDTTCTPNVTRFDCERPLDEGGLIGGVWKGEGTLCATATCEALGACCDGLNCTEVASDVCTNSFPSRIWYADERCDGNPCLDETGACCIEGVCSETTQNACFLAFGSFTVNATCAEVDCVPAGACCLPGGGCDERSFSACVAANGEFKGFGTSCDIPEICAGSDPCDAFPGLGNGDYTGDGVANWEDAPEFLNCMTDPGVTATLQCQCAFDFDGDGDVDIDDFMDFQMVYCVYCGCTPFDYDGSGTLDDADTAAFGDCMAGPIDDPAPTLDPSGHREKCLCVFDENQDWVVDLYDFQQYQSAYAAP